MKRMLWASAALTFTTAVAAAQTTTPELDGLVNVNIQDVLQDIAVDLNIDETNIPVTLQVPVSVAANVCGVDVNVLSAQVDTGDASCTATTGSQELTQVVQQEMAAGGSTDSDDTASDGPDSTDDTASDGSGTTEDTASDDAGTTDDTASGSDTNTDDTASEDSGSSSDDVASDDDAAPMIRRPVPLIPLANLRQVNRKRLLTRSPLASRTGQEKLLPARGKGCLSRKATDFGGPAIWRAHPASHAALHEALNRSRYRRKPDYHRCCIRQQTPPAIRKAVFGRILYARAHPLHPNYLVPFD